MIKKIPAVVMEGPMGELTDEDDGKDGTLGQISKKCKSFKVCSFELKLFDAGINGVRSVAF